MATKPIRPLLSLDTLAAQPTVAINKVLYQLASPDSLSVMDYKRLGIIMPRIDALFALRKMTAADETELKQLFATVCRIVLAAPPAVLNKLTDLQRVQIYQVFLRLPHETLLRVGAMLNGARVEPTTGMPNKTGASSRRASRSSTAARRSSGSRGSRAPSSVPAS